MDFAYRDADAVSGDLLRASKRADLLNQIDRKKEEINVALLASMESYAKKLDNSVEALNGSVTKLNQSSETAAAATLKLRKSSERLEYLNGALLFSTVIVSILAANTFFFQLFLARGDSVQTAFSYTQYGVYAILAIFAVFLVLLVLKLRGGKDE